MQHLLEDNNLSVLEDTILPCGQLAKGGSKVTIVSTEGEYNGYKMRVPPPEFEALMFFNALEAATKAEQLKKLIKINKSIFDGMPEVDTSSENMQTFFNMCQQAMSSITFSISSIESWVNKSFVLFGRKNGELIRLKLSRPDKSDRFISSDKVASDLGVSIRPKIFQLAPQIYNVPALKEHSTLRKSIKDLIDERNIIMHMQSNLTLNDIDLGRVSYAVKLFKINAFEGPELILRYLNYIYEKSSISAPTWLEVANRDLKSRRKKIKN
ncbi:hypothetical protein [Photobacterium phosphoreum]|uniref:hypothetical protein n=1 Tax=Photobacterium phosphoreum TaxID=659 RepID=UPI000D158859|nr:hypothetical protein [Photobacterium phosphoreum]PSU55161.1 hypothetical protein CTM75_19985 [Photobacterium phosphoreum]